MTGPGAGLEARAGVVIVGGGQAGAMTALALRRHGHTGRILILGEEDRAPYDRPPLSKEVLLGKAEEASWCLLPAEVAAAQGIGLRLGCRVAALDRRAQRVELADGGSEPYDRLVLATGGRPRILPGLEPDGRRVFVLRSRPDADRLRAALATAAQVLVVGGGWLGLEIAASARQAGAAVTLLEASPRLCARVLPAEPAAWLESLHRANGVEVRLNAAATGDEPADIVAVAIGMTANDGLARAAGLACDDGVLTDAAGRTSDPAVFAVGDVSRFPHPVTGQPVRLESWQNANLQGEAAARAILDLPPAAPEPSWFWSAQFGRTVQAAGLPDPRAVAEVRDDGDQPIWRYAVGTPAEATVAVDRPRDVRRTLSDLRHRLAAASA